VLQLERGDDLTIDEVVKEANRLRKTVPRLVNVAPVSKRTIRYYVGAELLRPPGTRGPTARYPKSSVCRVLFIRLIQQEPVADAEDDVRRPTLEDVRGLLEQLSEEKICDVVLGKEPLEIRLGLTEGELERRRLRGEQTARWTGIGRPLSPASESGAVRRWRIPVTPNVEIRGRGEISSAQKRRLRLIARLVRELLDSSPD
jgi:DNA-binding transcriptional MerR regulator